MTIRQRISAWLQYLYFLRFSIVFWFFLPALVLLDHLGYTTTITRAFMAPDSFWQAFHIAFFTVSLQIVVLVTTRNFCMNGRERFLTAPPSSLLWLYCSPKSFPVWLALTLAQIPAGITLAYVAHVTRIEGESNFHFFKSQSHAFIWLYFAAGILAATFFWYVVSLFYYWTYTEPKSDLSSKLAKPLIFPEFLFGDLGSAPRPKLAAVLELPLRGLVRFTYPGFAPGPGGPLWELHFLSFVSLLGFFLLYLFLYPLTAPVPRGDDLRIGSFVAFAIALLFILGIVFTPTRGYGRWATPVKYFFILLSLTLAGTFSYSAFEFLHGSPGERGLPVLASILIICSFTLWAFGGLAFLLDRYRIPVITTLLLILFLPKLVHWTFGEHYFLAVDRQNTAVIPPSPAQALSLRTQDPNDPMIIITATGGGIHAAAWTTEILGRLEQSFASDPTLRSSVPNAKPYRFYDHVLLASSVSGGSVGLMSYLLEYTAPQPFDPEHPPTDRMTNAAACSSIEDVAWGLEYYDLERFVTNVWFSRAATMPPDRNWALSKAFSRNLNDALCHTSSADLHGLGQLKLDGETFTLGKGAELLESRQLPAFALNTTAVETGGRFLLSNYQIPKNADPGSDLLPAESFLHTYGEPCEGGGHKSFADLSLATAARLSATFPYVSSASRVPAKYADHGYHFVDGGYYDNDGTASVIEFLNSALTTSTSSATADPCLTAITPNPTSGDAVGSSGGRAKTATSPSKAPLAILLIEIRNGDDLNPLDNVDDYNFQDHPKDQHNWAAVSQLSAPVGALWQAGHESVTRRNRLGLCLLETSHLDSLVIHHVVFNFDPAPPNPGGKNDADTIQPLNWHLTAGERAEIHAKAYDDYTKAAIENAKSWVRDILKRESESQPKHLTAADTVEACRIAWVRAKPVSH